MAALRNRFALPWPKALAIDLGVSRTGLQLKLWIPVVVWMAFIFWGSTDLLSSRNTSRFIGPLLRWLKPDISNDTIRAVQALIRKTGHVTEFGVLAMLAWRAWPETRKNETRRWSWRRAGCALALAAMYAVSDEVHQSFVPTRQGSALDVLIDSAGAAGGLAVIWAWGRWRCRW